jgi:two-component system nitrate/nitrite sensor histidine kinase NarX
VNTSEHTPSDRRSRWFRFGITAIVLLLGLGFGFYFWGRGWVTWERFIWLCLAFVLAGIAGWMVSSWLSLKKSQRQIKSQLEATAFRLGHIQNRLTTVLHMNNRLADADDEQTLMEDVLGQIGGLVGAQGSSYIPMDELGQPLAFFSRGDVPENDKTAWLTHLVSPEVEEYCRNCKLRQSALAATCPLHEPTLFGANNIFCIPVHRGERVLGMVNLYLPAGERVPEDLSAFIESLLNEIALAIETIRLRNQEMATLRQIQLVRTPKRDLTELLKGLLDGAQQALEADYGLVVLRKGEQGTHQVIFGRGDSRILDAAEVEAALEEAYKSGSILSVTGGMDARPLPAGVGAVLIAPLAADDSAVIGAIVLGNAGRQAFYPRQLKVVAAVAAQAALIVENARFITGLEYRAIIDERTRLSREIHDGLAQTLAFLKLQSSQMQIYLARGDLARLQELVQTSNKTLSDAYVDTRQAIDNLRIAPREGIEDWLQKAVADFHEVTKIQVELSIKTAPVDLPPEIQAQLIRVVQEALSNIRKHARAGHVTISIRRWKEDLILEVRDDGQGFSPEDVPSISQYGLRGMRERAELIGADFQIISSPNQGTTVRLRLPFRLEETPV